MKDTSLFAKRMKEAREKKGLKQNVLAELVGVTPQTISAYEKAEENGKGKNPTIENAIAISKNLGVSLDWLCGIESEKESGDTIKTVGDIARAIVEIFKIRDFGYVSLEMEQTRQGENINTGYPDITKESLYCPAIVFSGGELKRFVEDLKKMDSLLKDDTISNELYSRWLSDRVHSLDSVECYNLYSNEAVIYEPLPF